MAHAILSPSSISRIIRCPASARPNAEAERTGSLAASRGTAIHEMVEALLKKRLEGITLSDYYLGQHKQLMVSVLKQKKMILLWLKSMWTTLIKELKN